MAVMNKYLIWTSLLSGEYIFAEDMLETETSISFIKNSQVFRSFSKDTIYGYGLVDDEIANNRS